MQLIASCCHRRVALTKTLRVMKLTAFIMIVCCLHVSAGGVSQTVSFSGRDIGLKTVFEAVEKQTGFVFFYDGKLLESANPVTINARQLALEAFLQAVLKDQPLKYTIRDKTILIARKKAEPVVEVPLYVPITGIVRDTAGRPLPDVSVSVKGSAVSVKTDHNGRFTINAEPGQVLIFTSVNTESYELRIDNDTELSVRLRSRITQLNEVSILSTGYQSIPKERATGSFSSVEAKELDRQIAVSDIREKFKTLLPGVLMSGNDPIIRGKSTINGNQAPIIVIDGFPTELSLAALNPNDVERITVLRDAAAASIWGVRASNGVIVITTKQGKKNANGRPAFSFTSSVKMQEMPDIASLKLANSQAYVDVEIEALTKGWYNLNNPNNNMGNSRVYEIFRKRSRNEITEAEANAQYDLLRNNNSYAQDDLFFRKGIFQQYNLSASGATDVNRYYVSFNYQHNQPYSRGNNDQRMTLFIKNSYQFLPRLRLDADINLSFIKGENNGVLLDAFVLQKPYELFVDAQGNYVPVYDSYRTVERNKELQDKGYYDWNYNVKRDVDNSDNRNTNFAPRINLGVNYKILDGLSFDSKAQYERRNYKSEVFNNEEMYATRDLINKFTILTAGAVNNQIPRGPIYNMLVEELEAYSWRNQLKYDKELGEGLHRISAIAGTEVSRSLIKTNESRLHNYNKEKLTFTSINEKQLSEGVTNWNGLQAFYPLLQPAREVENRYFSMYFNGSYTYADKYTFSTSGRIDKSNLLGVNVNDRMTPLYSIGLAWNVSKESFFTSTAVNDLKIRATMGVNGNVDKKTSRVLIGTPQKNTYSTGEDYLQILYPENKELKWESTRVNNLGVDMAMFRNRITVSLDLYNKKSFDLLGYVNADPSVGFQRIYKNTAEMKNNGFDLQLGADVLKGTVRWHTTLNLSYNRNKVTKVYNPSPTVDNYLTGGPGREIVGKPIDYFYSFNWAGLSAQGEPQAYNNKGEVVSWQSTTDLPTVDWLVYSGSTLPDYYGAFINTFSYKGFSLTPIITYRLGHVMRLPTTYIRSTSTILSDIERRWRKPGDEAFTDVPRLYDNANEPYARRQFYAMNSNRTASASFVRLSNLSLTYDFPARLTGRVFRNLQLQAQATDIALWTRNKEGIDPEAVSLRYGTLSPAVSSTYTLGLKVDF